MNQPVPSDNNPSSDIEQHVSNSDVDGGIQAIHGDNNKQVQIINYYYREATKVVTDEFTDTDNENLPCPYRGLFHFGPDDAEFFFGREVFVEELFGATQTRNFIPVLGASGSGKSSVVLAGLVPRLQEEGNWLFTHFRPGSEPFNALALALVPLYTPDLNATERIAQARQLANYLREETISLADVFAQIHQNHQNFRVLLIADQFEELYTLCTDGKIRRSFLDVLLANFHLSTSQSQYNNFLIATMRADFLGNALSYPQFGDLLQNSDIKIRSMNHEELQEVIIKPAQKLGVTFEAGLVERILDDVDSEPGNLPLLEFALTQLWKRRTGKQLSHVAYEEIGEVEGALARHADENYRKLSEVEREQVRRIFIQLVRPGEGTEDTRRLATKAELGNDVSWGLVKKLADVRLVVTTRNAADKETVEVIHEALISNWGTFRQWMDADRNFRIWQERLRVMIYQWEQTQRDEGALLRGAALVEAQEKLQQRKDDFSQDEQEFIEDSLLLQKKYQKQRERTRNLILSGLLAISFAAIGTAIYTNEQRLIAQKTLKNTEVLAEILNAENQLASHLGLEAVVTSLKAAKKLKQVSKDVEVDNYVRVVTTLQKVLYNIRERNRLEGHSDAINSVAFSPDGRIIATVSDDETIKLWNIQGNLKITLKGHKDVVNRIAFSPDSKIIATASDDKTIKLWNIKGNLKQTFKGHNGGVSSIAFSPDGEIIASASSDRTMKLWDTQGELLKTFKGHNGGVSSIAFSPNGETIASASFDKTIKLWDKEGNVKQTLKGHNGGVSSIAFSPDGEIIASASSDRIVKLWNTQGKVLQNLKGHNDRVSSVAFSPNGEIIASASFDKTVKLWDKKGQLKYTLQGHDSTVSSVTFSADSKTIASASFDKTVKLWRNIPHNLKGDNSLVNNLAFSPDGKTIFTSSYQGKMKLWNIQGATTQIPKGKSVYNMSLSPNGKTIATISNDYTIKLWNNQGKLQQILPRHTGFINSIEFSPHNNTILFASQDGSINLWNTQGKVSKSFKISQGNINKATFSPDGKKIAVSIEDKGNYIVKFLNTQGKLLKTLKGHSGTVNNLKFSPNSKTIATASDDKTIKLWTNQGRLLKTFKGHSGPVNNLTFSPDGKTIATASEDKTIKLWNSQGQVLQTFKEHSNTVNNVIFSPDGKTIASMSDDGTVKLWDLDLDYLLVKLCNSVDDYLNNNPYLSKEDKALCDDIQKNKIAVSTTFEFIANSTVSQTNNYLSTTFHCIMRMDKSLVTVARRGNRQTEPIIIWNNRSNINGENRIQRCETYSRRLTRAVAENGGKLSRLMMSYGKLNGNTVICYILSPRERCSSQNMLLTLRESESDKVQEILRDIAEFSVRGSGSAIRL